MIICACGYSNFLPIIFSQNLLQILFTRIVIFNMADKIPSSTSSLSDHTGGLPCAAMLLISVSSNESRSMIIQIILPKKNEEAHFVLKKM